jgi:dimethylglycine dehydrogenase
VQIEEISERLCGLALQGPTSRDLLKVMGVGGIESLLHFGIMETTLDSHWIRIDRAGFTGDLGYELWVAPDAQCRLYDDILAAGADLGLRLFGGRALDSLRLEKSYGSWSREYRPLYSPAEAGLERFVDLRKSSFVGREAVLRERAAGPKLRLVTFTIEADDADVVGDEAVWHDGEVVGWVTSGGYAHWADRSVALAYLPAALAQAEGDFAIEILGERRPARLQPEPLFDPKRERMLG